MSVVIHEVSHGLAARALGDKTAEYEGRLTLNPLKHLDPFGSIILPLILFLTHAGFIIGWAKPVPYNPYNFDIKWRKWGDAFVAIAGPLSNILLALIFGLLLRFSPMLIGLFGYDLINTEATVRILQTIIPLFQTIVITNLSLAIFNLVPIPPLDGSKIVSALIPYQYRNITYKIERYALPLAVVGMFIIWPFLSPVVFRLYDLIVGI